MWYFSWILGTALALAFGVLNAMWYELMDRSDGQPETRSLRPEQPPAAPESEP
jgi:cytochrome bd-I ubiquinol oxidase subunit X